MLHDTRCVRKETQSFSHEDSMITRRNHNCHHSDNNNHNSNNNTIDGVGMTEDGRFTSTSVSSIAVESNRCAKKMMRFDERGQAYDGEDVLRDNSTTNDEDEGDAVEEEGDEKELEEEEFEEDVRFDSPIKHRTCRAVRPVEEEDSWDEGVDQEDEDIYTSYGSSLTGRPPSRREIRRGFSQFYQEEAFTHRSWRRPLVPTEFPVKTFSSSPSVPASAEGGGRVPSPPPPPTATINAHTSMRREEREGERNAQFTSSSSSSFPFSLAGGTAPASFYTENVSVGLGKNREAGEREEKRWTPIRTTSENPNHYEEDRGGVGESLAPSTSSLQNDHTPTPLSSIGYTPSAECSLPSSGNGTISDKESSCTKPSTPSMGREEEGEGAAAEEHHHQLAEDSVVSARGSVHLREASGREVLKKKKKRSEKRNSHNTKNTHNVNHNEDDEDTESVGDGCTTPYQMEPPPWDTVSHSRQGGGGSSAIDEEEAVLLETRRKRKATPKSFYGGGSGGGGTPFSAFRSSSTASSSSLPLLYGHVDPHHPTVTTTGISSHSDGPLASPPYISLGYPSFSSSPPRSNQGGGESRDRDGNPEGGGESDQGHLRYENNAEHPTSKTRTVTPPSLASSHHEEDFPRPSLHTHPSHATTSLYSGPLSFASYQRLETMNTTPGEKVSAADAGSGIQPFFGEEDGVSGGRGVVADNGAQEGSGNAGVSERLVDEAPITLTGVNLADPRRKRLKKVSHYILGPLLGEGMYGVVRDAIDISATPQCAAVQKPAFGRGSPAARLRGPSRPLSTYSMVGRREEVGREREHNLPNGDPKERKRLEEPQGEIGKGSHGRGRTTSTSKGGRAGSVGVSLENSSSSFSSLPTVPVHQQFHRCAVKMMAVPQEESRHRHKSLMTGGKRRTLHNGNRAALLRAAFNKEVVNLQRFHCPYIMRAIDLFSRYGKEYMVLPIAICSLQEFIVERRQHALTGKEWSSMGKEGGEREVVPAMGPHGRRRTITSREELEEGNLLLPSKRKEKRRRKRRGRKEGARDGGRKEEEEAQEEKYPPFRRMTNKGAPSVEGGKEKEKEVKEDHAAVIGTVVLPRRRRALNSSCSSHPRHSPHRRQHHDDHHPLHPSCSSSSLLSSYSSSRSCSSTPSSSSFRSSSSCSSASFSSRSSTYSYGVASSRSSSSSSRSFSSYSCCSTSSRSSSSSSCSSFTNTDCPPSPASLELLQVATASTSPPSSPRPPASAPEARRRSAFHSPPREERGRGGGRKEEGDWDGAREPPEEGGGAPPHARPAVGDRPSSPAPGKGPLVMGGGVTACSSPRFSHPYPPPQPLKQEQHHHHPPAVHAFSSRSPASAGSGARDRGGRRPPLSSGASCSSFGSVGGRPLSHPPRSSLFSTTFIKGAFYQILSAVAYLHAQQLAHNDIKPSNILLFEDGSLRLTDLAGVSARYKDQGTPLFASPELARDYYGCGTMNKDAEEQKQEPQQGGKGKKQGEEMYLVPPPPLFSLPSSSSFSSVEHPPHLASTGTSSVMSTPSSKGAMGKMEMEEKGMGLSSSSFCSGPALPLPSSSPPMIHTATPTSTTPTPTGTATSSSSFSPASFPPGLSHTPFFEDREGRGKSEAKSTEKLSVEGAEAEEIKKALSVDPKACDMWCCGLVLYTLVTGKPGPLPIQQEYDAFHHDNATTGMHFPMNRFQLYHFIADQNTPVCLDDIPNDRSTPSISPSGRGRWPAVKRKDEKVEERVVGEMVERGGTGERGRELEKGKEGKKEDPLLLPPFSSLTPAVSPVVPSHPGKDDHNHYYRNHQASPAPSRSHPGTGLRDLLAGLLELDPKKRLTAEQALRHPWMELTFIRRGGKWEGRGGRPSKRPSRRHHHHHCHHHHHHHHHRHYHHSPTTTASQHDAALDSFSPSHRNPARQGTGENQGCASPLSSLSLPPSLEDKKEEKKRKRAVHEGIHNGLLGDTSTTPHTSSSSSSMQNISPPAISTCTTKDVLMTSTDIMALSSSVVKESMNWAIQREVASRVLASHHFRAMILKDKQRHLQFVADCCQTLGIPIPQEILISQEEGNARNAVARDGNEMGMDHKGDEEEQGGRARMRTRQLDEREHESDGRSGSPVDGVVVLAGEDEEEDEDEEEEQKEEEEKTREDHSVKKMDPKEGEKWRHTSEMMTYNEKKLHHNSDDRNENENDSQHAEGKSRSTPTQCEGARQDEEEEGTLIIKGHRGGNASPAMGKMIGGFAYPDVMPPGCVDPELFLPDSEKNYYERKNKMPEFDVRSLLYAEDPLLDRYRVSSSSSSSMARYGKREGSISSYYPCYYPHGIPIKVQQMEEYLHNVVMVDLGYRTMPDPFFTAEGARQFSHETPEDDDDGGDSDAVVILKAKSFSPSLLVSTEKAGGGMENMETKFKAACRCTSTTGLLTKRTKRKEGEESEAETIGGGKMTPSTMFIKGKQEVWSGRDRNTEIISPSHPDAATIFHTAPAASARSSLPYVNPMEGNALVMEKEEVKRKRDGNARQEQQPSLPSSPSSLSSSCSYGAHDDPAMTPLPSPPEGNTLKSTVLPNMSFSSSPQLRLAKTSGGGGETTLHGAPSPSSSSFTSVHTVEKGNGGSLSTSSSKKVVTRKHAATPSSCSHPPPHLNHNNNNESSSTKVGGGGGSTPGYTASPTSSGQKGDTPSAYPPQQSSSAAAQGRLKHSKQRSGKQKKKDGTNSGTPGSNTSLNQEYITVENRRLQESSRCFCGLV